MQGDVVSVTVWHDNNSFDYILSLSELILKDSPQLSISNYDHDRWSISVLCKVI